MKKLYIAINPIGKPRMTRRDKWTDADKGKGRPAVLRYFAYKEELILKLPNFEVPKEFEILFEIEPPKSYSQKKRAALLGTPHQLKPDIDNLLKAFLDTLCEDDSFVWKVTMSKVWAEQGGITITY